MREFFHYVIGNNTIGAYLWTLGIILFVFFLKKVFSRTIASLLCRAFSRIWPNFDTKTFVDLVIPPLGIFLVITVSIVTLYRLHFPQQLDIELYKYKLHSVLLALAILLQIGAFIWLILRSIDFIAVLLQQQRAGQPAQSEYQLIVFFRDFLKVIVIIVGGMLILRFSFGYNISTLLTGLSIVGAAIALALRESLENLIASFVIFFDKPFTIGDFVKVQTVAGNVERIGLRSTRIRTADKSYVTVPNKQMVDSILDNVSLRTQLRGFTELNLHVHTPPARAEQLLQDLRGFLKEQADVQNFTVALSDIRPNTIVATVEYFTRAIPNDRFVALRQSVNFFVLRRMEELGIQIAVQP
ncbi:mechanosensitive ion channel family protein [Flaviaesturariibacter flavus]|uniref:Mechanosensitive ion channel family protein n=1 Tax=Flaviaesturariibacter flavus TaxID=2502780 RepID=A0A4R1BAW4_9BACT|nr:mechanosensitive ion channel family protein [Flaviaesturariibacter flavus]TCJ14094.1 mechanosensitive ion channel family protein [Flaviaesturariibacter flavus]